VQPLRGACHTLLGEHVVQHRDEVQIDTFDAHLQ